MEIEKEINAYMQMLSEKGYGHTIEDQRKRVNAGVIIAKNFYKKEINNHDKLIEALKESIEIMETYILKFSKPYINANNLLNSIQKETV